MALDTIGICARASWPADVRVVAAARGGDQVGGRVRPPGVPVGDEGLGVAQSLASGGRGWWPRTRRLDAVGHQGVVAAGLSRRRPRVQAAYGPSVVGAALEHTAPEGCPGHLVGDQFWPMSVDPLAVIDPSAWCVNRTWATPVPAKA